MLLLRRCGTAAAVATGAAAWLATPPAIAADAVADAEAAPAPTRYGLYLPAAAREAIKRTLKPALPYAWCEKVLLAPEITIDEGATDADVDIIAYAATASVETVLVGLPHGWPVREGRDLPRVVVAAATADAAAAEEAADALWAQLEANGHIIIDRRKDGAPWRVRLRGGEAQWEGAITGDRESPGFGTTAAVRAPRKGQVPGLLQVPAQACTDAAWEKGECVRECGFCKFMKGGPCRDEFIAWEACVDRSRTEGSDFIEACGQHTLKLKACTDEHPEYYGALMADAEEDAAQRKEKEGDVQTSAAAETGA